MPSAAHENLPEALRVVYDLVRRSPKEAEAQLAKLIYALTDSEVVEYRAAVNKVLNRLPPEQRRALALDWAKRVIGADARAVASASSAASAALLETNAPQAKAPPDVVCGDSISETAIPADTYQTAPSPVAPATAGLPSTPFTDEAPTQAVSQASTIVDRRDVEAFGRTFRQQLVDLSDRHIFQWETYYRDVLLGAFDRVRELLEATAADEALQTLRHAIRRHASEIFRKGFDYQTQQLGSTSALAQFRAQSGLRMFVSLPIEIYSSLRLSVWNSSEAYGVRETCSAMVAGILEGFGEVWFGDRTGGEVLARETFAREWIKYCGFLTADHLDSFAAMIPQGWIRTGLVDVLDPVLYAIDSVVAEGSDDSAWLPVSSLYNSQFRRLEVTLSPRGATRNTESLLLHAYLDWGTSDRLAFSERRLLEESANRNACLIAASVPGETEAWIKANDLLSGRFLNTYAVLVSSDVARDSAAQTLHIAAGKAAGGASWHTIPLSGNIARDFPLDNPNLAEFYRVRRPSVRDLLHSAERRNGVQLWCSVRRSGKTTACFALSSFSDSTIVISQTCSDTEEYANSNVFYTAFRAAIESRSRIGVNFLSETIQRCSERPIEPGQKSIFLIDEYERLFDESQQAVLADPKVRLNVVQPLLNQMVAFSRNHLLILVGQRPHADHIVMDQNQLSAFVQQQHFPLFTYTPRTRGGEFEELLNVAFAGRAEMHDSFLDALFWETGGHPYLTVNLIRTFVDWLINRKWPTSDLCFSQEHYDEFAKDALTDLSLAANDEYAYFRGVTRNAMGRYGREQMPWLYAVYTTMRRMAIDDPVRMECSTDDFVRLVDTDAILGWHPAELLGEAVKANFFSLYGDKVRPRIPLLARLAAVVRPQIGG